MMLNAAFPFTTMSVACCQERDAASSLVYWRIFPNISHTFTASGLVKESVPSHSCCHFSGPSTAKATDSHRWFAVQFVAKARGTTPCACSLGAIVRNSSHVFGASTPHFSRFAGMYHITLERWMFTGTDQIPLSVLRSLISPDGNTSIHPSCLNSQVRSSMRSAFTHVPISSWPACTWKLSGGLPPSMRVFSTALALTPEPPVTVALIRLTPGCWALYMSIRACSAGPSSPAHQEKISRSPVKLSANTVPKAANSPIPTSTAIASFLNLIVPPCMFFLPSVFTYTI